MAIIIYAIHGLVDYNILHGLDYIYAMQAMVSSLFWIIIFPYEGHLITID